MRFPCTCRTTTRSTPTVAAPLRPPALATITWGGAVGGGWIGNSLLPYTKNTSIYVCPSNPRIAAVNGGFNGTTGLPTCNTPALTQVAYALISYMFKYNTVSGQAMTAMQSPAESALVWDSINPWGDCAFYNGGCGLTINRDICYFRRKNNLPLTHGENCTVANGAASNWHNNGNNYLYGDGHVKWARWDQLKWGNLASTMPTNHPVFEMNVMRDPPGATGFGIN